MPEHGSFTDPWSIDGWRHLKGNICERVFLRLWSNKTILCPGEGGGITLLDHLFCAFQC